MFWLFNYVNPLVFAISFIVGLIYVYLTTVEQKTVVQYPTPYNAGKITYIDDAGVCYKYRIKKVDCPLDSSKIKTLRPQ